MDFKRLQGNLSIKVDTSRLDVLIPKAQRVLDMSILNDCTPYVPFSQGFLRSSGHIADAGLIEWSAPYAHYQYEGVQYIDPLLGVSGVYTEGYGWWSHKGVQKLPTDRPLHYQEPSATDHWFETAKQNHMQDWENAVKRVFKGGL